MHSMKDIVILLLFFTVVSNVSPEVMGVSNTSLHGKITDKNGEPIIGVSIYFPELKTGAITSIDGTYLIDNLPKRNMFMQISSVGYNMIAENIDLTNVRKRDFVMEESITEIKEVAITGQAITTQIAKITCTH